VSDVDHEPGDDEGDEVVFELSDWNDDDRSLVSQKLAAAGIAHAWEGTDLVVADADGDAAEDTIETVEYPDGLRAEDDIDHDGELDDGGLGYELMSALFVAADRLQRDPEDPRAGGEFDAASDAIAGTSPPYGVAAEVWQQIQELGANVAEQLDDADAEVIARDAGTLRTLLSRYM
jgi:hypothetical protein